VEGDKGLGGKGQRWFQIVESASAGWHSFIKNHTQELEKLYQR
jgi:hypothetical protein